MPSTREWDKPARAATIFTHNGAPTALVGCLEGIRRKLAGSDDGDRQMAKILATVLTDGLVVVDAAYAEALGEGVSSADVIINIVSRRRDQALSITILTPDALSGSSSQIEVLNAE